MKHFRLVCKRVELESSGNLQSTLGDANDLREWQKAGLPDAAIDNAIISKFSQRPSLFIDPQG